MKHSYVASSSHMRTSLDPSDLKDAVKRLRALIRASGVRYDAIAIRGMSGAIVGGALSAAVNKPLLLVRKPRDNDHTSYSVEGPVFEQAFRYIIVDDLICSGVTMDAILDGLDSMRASGQCQGIFLYRFWTRKGAAHKSHQGVKIPLYGSEPN